MALDKKVELSLLFDDVWRCFMSLIGKNVIMIASPFFQYDIEIKKALEKQGAKVSLYHDRPNEHFITKTLIRLEPKVLGSFIHQYYSKIVDENKEKNIDYVFFVKCESALDKDLKMFRQAFPNAKFILYMWDSIENIKHYDIKKDYFHNIYSFDHQNCKNHHEMKFLPLFYIDKYQMLPKEEGHSLYDVSFIGTGHSDRPRILNNVRKQLDNEGKPYYIRVYVPSKLLLYLKYFINKDFRELYKQGLVTTKKMSSDKISEIIDHSKSVIDIQHPKQTGLTMRTIELLGMNKKIITTNDNIQLYDFYTKENTIIIDRASGNMDVHRIDLPYKPIDENLYQSYSIHSWIKKMFLEEE